MRRIKILTAAAAALFSLQTVHARISVLSPWSLQDRQATEAKTFDQAAGFQFGLNGVSPAGGDSDAKFMAFPYRLTYGLIDKVELGTRLGLQWLDRRNRSSQFGISDISMAARYRFFDPNRAERTPGLDVEAGLSFPTGSFDKGLGTGGLGMLFGWGLVLPLDPVRAHFGMGFRYDTENSDDVRVGQVFSYNGGVTYFIPQYKDQLAVTGELKGFNHARNRVNGNKVGPAPDELYLCPGAIWNFDQRFQFSGAILIGLTTESSDLGLNLELRF